LPSKVLIDLLKAHHYQDMLIRVRKEDCVSPIEVPYDPEDGLEVLNYQLMSVFPDATEEFSLFDFAGRLLSTQEDIDDISNTIQLKLPINNEIQAIDTIQTDLSTINISDDRTVVSDNKIADIWCANNEYINTENYCTRKILSVSKSINTSYKNDGIDNIDDGKINITNDSDVSNDKGNEIHGNESFQEFIQPAYHIIDTTIRLCHRCQKLFDKSLIVHDTSELLSFVCQSNLAIDMGLAYTYAEEKLKSEEFKYYNPISMYMKRSLYNQAVGFISDSVREAEKERAFERRIIQVEKLRLYLTLFFFFVPMHFSDLHFRVEDGFL
jgi:hypothetical protein